MCGGKQETTGRVENDTRAGGMAVWRIVNAIFPPGKDMWKHVPNKLCSFCLYRAKDGFKEGRPRRKGQGLRGTLSHAESFAPPPHTHRFRGYVRHNGYQVVRIPHSRAMTKYLPNRLSRIPTRLSALPNPPLLKPRHFVVAVDPLDAHLTTKCLEYTFSHLARGPETDTVHLVQVVPSLLTPATSTARGFLSSAPNHGEMERKLVHAARRHLQEHILPLATATAEQAGLDLGLGSGFGHHLVDIPVEIHVVQANPYENIREGIMAVVEGLARAADTTLVVGSHHKPFLAEWLLGSVAKDVSSAADVPVVLIH